MTWRHMLYDDYKFGRKPTPEVLISNLDMFPACLRNDRRKKPRGRRL
jgi:hypothetical protein